MYWPNSQSFTFISGEGWCLETEKSTPVLDDFQNQGFLAKKNHNWDKTIMSSFKWYWYGFKHKAQENLLIFYWEGLHCELSVNLPEQPLHALQCYSLKHFPSHQTQYLWLHDLQRAAPPTEVAGHVLPLGLPVMEQNRIVTLTLSCSFLGWCVTSLLWHIMSDMLEQLKGLMKYNIHT